MDSFDLWPKRIGKSAWATQQLEALLSRGEKVLVCRSILPDGTMNMSIMYRVRHLTVYQNPNPPRPRRRAYYHQPS